VEEDRYARVLFSDVKVGDIIHLSCDEIIPADLLLLRSSEKQGLCFIGIIFLQLFHIPTFEILLLTTK
jgi:hypothetical protein